VMLEGMGHGSWSPLHWIRGGKSPLPNPSPQGGGARRRSHRAMPPRAPPRRKGEVSKTVQPKPQHVRCTGCSPGAGRTGRIGSISKTGSIRNRWMARGQEGAAD